MTMWHAAVGILREAMFAYAHATVGAAQTFMATRGRRA